MGCKIVEFTGAPGCGKSTLSELLTKTLMKDGLKVSNLAFKISQKAIFYRILLKIRYVLVYIVRHPLLCVKYTKFVNDSEQSSYKDAVRVYFNLVYVLGMYNIINNDSKYEVVIFDQGLIQAICSILISAHNCNLSKIPRLPIHHICHVIQVESNWNEILNRLNKRKGNQSRIESLPQEMILQEIKHYEQCFEVINNHFRISPVKITNNLFELVNQNVDIIKRTITTK